MLGCKLTQTRHGYRFCDIWQLFFSSFLLLKQLRFLSHSSIPSYFRFRLFSFFWVLQLFAGQVACLLSHRYVRCALYLGVSPSQLEKLEALVSTQAGSPLLQEVTVAAAKQALVGISTDVAVWSRILVSKVKVTPFL